MFPVMKALLSCLVRSDRGWSVLEKTLIRASDYARVRRNIKLAETPSEDSGAIPRTASDEAIIQEMISTQFPDLLVKHGPFAGMAYPAVDAVCSALWNGLS